MQGTTCARRRWSASSGGFSPELPSSRYPYTEARRGAFPALYFQMGRQYGQTRPLGRRTLCPDRPGAAAGRRL